MTFTAVGVAIPRDGFAVQHSLRQGRTGPEVHKRYLSVDPLRLRTCQGERIAVDYEHSDAIVGDVTYLEIGHGCELWAVAQMRGPMPTPARLVYWSVRARSMRDGDDVVLERVAVVEDPAMLGAQPLAFFDGELREYNLRHNWRVNGLVRDVLTRAVAATARPGVIVVHDVDAHRAEQREWCEPHDLHLRGGPVGGLRHGPPGKVLRVG